MTKLFNGGMFNGFAVKLLDEARLVKFFSAGGQGAYSSLKTKANLFSLLHF